MRALALLITLVLSVPSILAQSTPAGGIIAVDTTWSPAMGTILVYSNVSVTSGAKLTIEAGTTVRLTNNCSISAAAGCTIDVEGTSNNAVLFLPMVGNNRWGTINSSGNNSFVTVRHAELAYGGINLGTQATGTIEDCYIHDVTSAIVANSARFVTMRRNHVNRFSETIFNSGTIILAEDCLHENMTAADSDAFEIQGGPPGSIIRNCTFRHSTGANSDAIDFNGTSGVRVENCLVYDFTDKGVSLGASGAGGAPDYGITVTNCLIYNVGTGIAVKDGTLCGLFNLTIANSTFGYRLYQKFTTPVDGGHITNSFNNLLWGNGTTISLLNNSSIVANYCDFQGTNFPGTGNINSDPLFLNASLRDYRLATNSPAAATGFLGSDMGAHFPVGAAMALSHPKFASTSRDGTNALITFWADSEKTYSLQYRDDVSTGPWTTLTNFTTRPLPELITVSDSPPTGNRRFYQLITPQQP